ncbi:hypothetical protein E2C01_088872 [Portunus trituberculatus]|uniref:Uncharacterized protein n=1 Tax=Portunus trituberculatus TaxID=210409 RepID=A0A5B7JC00_PORTR|nr:hypothetical protein [Portunus trituberculatus]
MKGSAGRVLGTCGARWSWSDAVTGGTGRATTCCFTFRAPTPNWGLRARGLSQGHVAPHGRLGTAPARHSETQGSRTGGA